MQTAQPHTNGAAIRLHLLPLAYAVLATASALASQDLEMGHPIVLGHPTVLGQQQEPATTFPPKDWQTVTRKGLTRQQQTTSCTVQLDAKNTLVVHLKRPKGFDATVVTDQAGKELARGTASELKIKDCKIGDRYVVYLCQTEAKRAIRLREDFVQFPAREFPGKAWRPRKDAKLVLEQLQQSAPRTMLEAFEQHHQVSFAAAKSAERVVYLLTKFEAGGKEAVASQSLAGTLRFWLHAKRGESFRIYAIYPDDLTYCKSSTLTVKQSYPIGK